MLLLRSDFADCLQRQEDALRLLSGRQRLHLTRASSQAEVWLNRSSAPYAMTHDEVGSNFVMSVTELFEVHYAHMNPTGPDLFQISGVRHVSRLLMSRGRRAQALPNDLVVDMQALAASVTHHHAWQQVDSNRGLSFKVAGKEYVGLLNRAVGKRGLLLSEFAIGVKTPSGRTSTTATTRR